MLIYIKCLRPQTGSFDKMHTYTHIQGYVFTTIPHNDNKQQTANAMRISKHTDTRTQTVNRMPTSHFYTLRKSTKLIIISQCYLQLLCSYISSLWGKWLRLFRSMGRWVDGSIAVWRCIINLNGKNKYKYTFI